MRKSANRRPYRATRISMEFDKIKPAPAAHSERSAQAVGKTVLGAGTSKNITHKE
jgi:hypothetical protein